LKQWQQERETKDKKHFKLEGALNEVIYYIEVMTVKQDKRSFELTVD